MFSRKKDEKPRKGPAPGQRKNKSLAQLGLLEVPSVDDLNNDDDDGDLEAELLALTGQSVPTKKSTGKSAVVPEMLDKMVADCMKDDVDDELSDEDDQDLLDELSGLTSDPLPSYNDNNDNNDQVMSEGIQNNLVISNNIRPPQTNHFSPNNSPMVAGASVQVLLGERISMYTQAEENAVAAGDTSRARRFNRGLQTLKQMLTKSKDGKAINEEDIPPFISVNISSSSSSNFTTNKDVENNSLNSIFSSIPSMPVQESTTPPSSYNDPSTRVTPPQQQQVLPPPTDNRTIPQSVVFPPNKNHRHAPSPPVSTRPNTQRDSTNPNPDTKAPSRTTREPIVVTNNKKEPSSTLDIIKARHIEYKVAALEAKRTGDRDSALKYMRTMKQLEPLIMAAESGQIVDLESLPGVPTPDADGPSTITRDNSQPRDIPVTTTTNTTTTTDTTATEGEGEKSGPINVLDALEQRLNIYTEQRDKAKKDENSRKERMNQRIMKQYQDAIKHYKAGKPIAFDELPSPPGVPPLPSDSSTVQQPVPTTPTVPSGAPAIKREGQPEGATAAPIKQPKSSITAPQPQPPPPTNVRTAPKSRVERQLSYLENRQKLFKVAALDAKKRGEIEQAKEYLRNAKGIDQLVEVSRSGLPVDMNTVPVPPQEQVVPQSNLDFDVIGADDCVMSPPDTDGDTAVTYTKLEEDLIAQIKMCAQTREHFKAIGDVASANRFEQLILHTKKDLDSVRAGFKRGTNPPRFHYETRTFNVIQCNTDLNDTDCEVTVLRGINYNVENPNDVDTYIKIDFPYPADLPPQDKTGIVKDTNNPEYNHRSVFSIDRKSRALARLFKRQGVKMEVIAKGGWFHRSTTVGAVKVPLVQLENKCTIHDSYDLLDEKKKMVGGKLEVRIRVRNPIITKQLEKVTEKWLVIDGF